MIWGTLLFIMLFGTINYLHFDKFVYTSTTAPVNLIIGANNDATGLYNNKVFDEGKIGFISQPEKKTYVEKEDYWFKQAGKWIYNHPIKYVSLFPLKIVQMFIWDNFSVSGLIGLKDWYLYRFMKDILTGI